MRVEIEDVGFGFSPFPHELSRNRNVSLQAKGLFAVYGSFVKLDDPSAWASQEYLCKLCGGINEKTLLRYKKELIKSGWISQIQRRQDNGQHSTMVITRYYSPTLNKSISPMISTGTQKTACRKTAARKMVRQEQEPHILNNNKKHTEQEAPSVAAVCVSSSVLEKDQMACIEWVISEYRKTGSLKNEVGLRAYLVRSALAGKLSMDDYNTFLSNQARGREVTSNLLEKMNAWEKECEADPIDPEVFRQARLVHPGLFLGSGRLASDCP